MSEKSSDLPETGQAFSFNTDKSGRPLYYTYDRQNPVKVRLAESALMDATGARLKDREIYEDGVSDGKYEAQKEGAPEAGSLNPEIEKLKQQIQKLTADMQAMQEQLSTVKDENESLRAEKAELERELEEKQSGSSPAQDTPPKEETISDAPPDEPDEEETVVIKETAKNPTQGLGWRERFDNFRRGQSLYTSYLWHCENGKWARDSEPQVGERDNRVAVAALAVGAVVLAYLLFRKNGHDYDIGYINPDIGDSFDPQLEQLETKIDDTKSELEEKIDNLSKDHGIEHSPDGDSLTEQHKELSKEHGDLDRADDGGEGGASGNGDEEETGGGSDSEGDDGVEEAPGEDSGNEGDGSTDGAASGSHEELFNNQHGDRSVRSILPGNLEQERVGLYERIIDKDSGKVIVEHVTFKESGPYSESTVRQLRAEGYTVHTIATEVYDTVGPGPRGDAVRYMSVVR